MADKPSKQYWVNVKVRQMIGLCPMKISQYPLKSSTDQNCTKTEAPNIEASGAVFVEIVNVSIKALQELGILSRSFTDCQ